jgi:ABC-type Na+ efflux pump permease subunit
MAGWALIGAVFGLVGYVVAAVTLGAGFEQDLAAAAEREGVSVNAVATSTQAKITRDHGLYALITGLFLLLPPVFLLRAAGKVRTEIGGRLAQLAWWSALGTLLVWWTYTGLGLGLFADSEHLPPLVRDFGPLTVPLVSALSLLALGSLVFASEAVRGADMARRSARVATVVSILLGALSLLALFAAEFEDPVAPIVIVPGALILGIALLRYERQLRVEAGAR